MVGESSLIAVLPPKPCHDGWSPYPSLLRVYHTASRSKLTDAGGNRAVMDFDADQISFAFPRACGLEHGGSTVKHRIHLPLVIGLLIAASSSSLLGQINSGYFPDGAPLEVVEPFYDPGGLTTGCFRDPGPCWLGQATFDVLMFGRSDADAGTIVNQVTSTLPTTIVRPLLDTKGMGFPVTAGFRFNLVLAGDDGCDLVFNYLGATFDTSRVHGSEPASYSYFEFSSVIPDAGLGSTFQTSYRSTLTSVEMNGRTRQWSRFAPLAGVRFIQLEDNFDRLLADTSAGLQLSETDNQLWGFQVGGEALLWDAGPVRLQSTMKAGVFYNDLDLNTGGGDITSGTATIETTQKFSSDHVSYFGEINLELAYRIGRHLSVRAGYTAMWLDGVALAPDQHDDFSLTSGIGSFDYGTVVYHGSYVGVEVTW